jgi:phasin family protein
VFPILKQEKRMPTFIPADVAASMQEQIAVRHARWSDLTSKTFDNMMRLVDAGLKATKDTIDESAAVAQQAIYSASPQDLLALGAEEGRSGLERMLTLGGDMAGIAAAMQADLGKAAQTEFTDGFQRMASLVESISGGVPDDSPSPYAVMKFALDKANSGYEQWAAMTRQVAEAVDSNLGMTAGLHGAPRAAGRARAR